MFIQNKYTSWYFSIVSASIKRGWTKNNTTVYLEKHHIIPKSCGGKNTIDNLVFVTAKEHYILHHLLIRMLSEKQHHVKMVKAFWSMANVSKRKVHPREYVRLREMKSTDMKSNNPAYDKTGTKNPFYGKQHTQEFKDRQSNIMKNKVPWNKGRSGSKHSEEHKAKIAHTMKIRAASRRRNQDGTFISGL